MRTSTPFRVLSAVALIASGILVVPVMAEAGPLGAARTASSDAGIVIQVHDRWAEHRHYRHHRRYKSRGDRHGRYVRAPFSRVETRGHRWTSVDAPFASVRVRPRGVWVRAPFVDLYVPR